MKEYEEEDWEFYRLSELLEEKRPAYASVRYLLHDVKHRVMSQIFKCAEVAVIRIEGCNGREIPLGLGGLSAFRSLTIEDSKIERLPADLASCKNLERLVIRNCPIAEIPSAILMMPSLVDLHLEGLPLKSKKINVSELPSLLYFSAIGCGLQQVDANARSVRKLDLRDNNLTELPHWIPKLPPRLMVMDVSNNPVKKLPEYFFLNTDYSELICDGVDIFHKKFQQHNKSYFYAAQRLRAKEDMARLLYYLLCEDLDYCRKATLRQLLQAATVASLFIADSATALLEERSSQALATVPLTQSACVLILGRFARPLEEIEGLFRRAGNSTTRTFTPEVTHILLGRNIRDPQIELLETAGLPYLFERRMEDYFNNAGIFELLRQDPEAPAFRQQLESLSALFLSGDAKKAEVAANIIINDGLPKQLITAAFIAYKLHAKNPRISDTLKQILYRSVSWPLWRKSQRSASIIGKKPTSPAWKNYMNQTELDINVIQAFCAAKRWV